MKLSEKVKEREKSFEAKLDSHILIRVDGKNFSKWTKDLEKPYDKKLTTVMKNTARALMTELGAQTAYTQSDEITLFLKAKEGSQHFVGGRLQKLCSLSAAFATSFFQEFAEEEGLEGKGMPVFDARVWAEEDFRNVCDAFKWRERDAIKNSVNAVAQMYYSPKELHKKHTALKLEMLREKGIHWERYPKEFRFGVHLLKITTSRPYRPEELENLPPKHNAHKNPEDSIERNEIIEVTTSGTRSIKNYQSFIYEGKLP